MEKAWWAIPVSEVEKYFNSNTLDGLDAASVLIHKKKWGDNDVPEKKPTSLFILWIRQLKNPLIYILLSAGVVAALLGDWSDAILVSIVVIVNATFGCIQEFQAEKGARLLSKYLALMTEVIRGGVVQTLPAKDLVPGDIVNLSSGQRCPADIRIFESTNLLVDESLLTGESLPVQKESRICDLNSVLSERRNILYSGTVIYRGRARGIVIATGTRTELGKIAHLADAMITTTSPLAIKLSNLAKVISIIVIVIGIVIVSLVIQSGDSWKMAISIALALIVAAIPESLPIGLTVRLSLAARRLTKHGVVVKKLDALEALGSCTIICTDKTGTLTYNKQNLVAVWIQGKLYECDDLQHKNYIRPVLEAALLASERVSESSDPIDKAIHKVAESYGVNFPFTHILIPYESDIGWSAGWTKELQGAVKGSWEKIRPHSNDQEIEEAVQKLSQQGYRLIVVARSSYHESIHTTQDLQKLQLKIIGLLCFRDPVRIEVPDAVRKVRDGGVEVVMVTGDHPATALSIAKVAGIATKESEVVAGYELDEILHHSPKKLFSYKVFARISPEQKLVLVNFFQKNGHYVAVTGDGVNDAPALRAAHVGIAMGTGTEVARDVAGVVLQTDSFASLVEGVIEGRGIGISMKRLILFLVGTGMSQIVLILGSFIIGLPLPLLPIQLLWLNIATGAVQDFALAQEPKETTLHRNTLTHPSHPLIDRDITISLLTISLSIGITGLIFSKILIEQNLTSANFLITYFVFVMNILLLSVRAETPLWKNIFLKSKWIPITIILVMAIHFFIISSEIGSRILLTERVSISLIISMVILTVLSLTPYEIYKKYRKSQNI